MRLLKRAAWTASAALLVAVAFYLPFAFLFQRDRPGPAEAEPEAVRPVPVARPLVRAEPVPATPPARPAEPVPAPAPPPVQTVTPRRPPTADVQVRMPEHVLPDSAIDQVRDALERGYYVPISPAVLARPSLFEIIEGLDDPFTEYLDPSAFERLQERTSRVYEGVGLLVSPVGEGLLVTTSLEGPARAAGVRPGDLIVAVDGRPVDGMSVDQAAELIKGEQGTIVRLTIRRDGERQPTEVSVIRQEIDTPVVRTRELSAQGRRIGYLGIFSFPQGTSAVVRAEARRLLAAGVDAVVLDLRDNPGGLLDEAIDVASVFLRSGVVVETIGRQHGAKRLLVKGGSVAPDVPLAVIVNGRSASAAEIVAAALADNDRAVVVGRRSYGKGSVQSVVALENGGALRYTSAIYLTPSGDAVSGAGIRPTVKAEDDAATPRDEAVVAAERELVERIGRASAAPMPPF